MATQFVCEEDGDEISVWTETDDQTVEAARDTLEDIDLVLSDEEIDERIRVIPSPTRIKSSAEEVLLDMYRRGGVRAAERVEDGMTIGLGTGSTTAWAIAAIGWKIDDDELTDVRGTATSHQSHELAKVL